MREIKFKVNIKDTSIVVDVKHISFIQDNIVVKIYNSAVDEEILFDSDEVELLQYTGLKDKNGVEIYEGDIVECFNDGLSEVLFRKGSFGTLTYTSRGVDFYTFNEVYGACEIIGNIYENPELLEV